jgi:peptidoglycan/xylan/chitin deacetylase (PgdA/CDA1 family)
MTADIERFSDAVTKFACAYTIDDIFSTRTLLDLFCDCDIPSTLFILGKAMVENPIMLDMVRENGFELASHGYNHIDFRTLTREQFRGELERSIHVLPVRGFRAPYYGFQPWMIHSLQHHFHYDSSKVSGRNKRLFFHDIHMLSETLMEIPVSSIPFVPLPFTSTAIRWLPPAILKKLAKIMVKKPHPFILNVHPWECVAIPQHVPVPFYVKKNTGRPFYRSLVSLLLYLRRMDVEFITMEQVYDSQKC